MSRYLQHAESDPNLPKPKSMSRPKVSCLGTQEKGGYFGFIQDFV